MVQEVTDSHEIWHLRVNREAEDAGHLQPPQVTLDVNGQRMTFVVDTGSPVSIIGSRTNTPGLRLGRSKLVLSSFTGHQIPIKGEADVTVRHGSASASLKIVKVDLPAINLLGRDWISALKLNKGRVRRMCPAGAQVAGGCNQVGVVEQQAREGKARRSGRTGVPQSDQGRSLELGEELETEMHAIHLENVRLRTQMRDMERRLAELEVAAGREQAATEMPRERNIRYAADDSAARVDDAQRVIRTGGAVAPGARPRRDSALSGRWRSSRAGSQPVGGKWAGTGRVPSSRTTVGGARDVPVGGALTAPRGVSVGGAANTVPMGAAGARTVRVCGVSYHVDSTMAVGGAGDALMGGAQAIGGTQAAQAGAAGPVTDCSPRGGDGAAGAGAAAETSGAGSAHAGSGGQPCA